MSGGRFYGIGVGPGDPELLTLKAERLLRQCAVVCTPKRNLRDDGYAAGIVRDLLRPAEQEELALEFPMNRDWERLKPYWERNAALIQERLTAGKDCAFVTEGDPFLYSTFIYLYQYLRRHHPEVPIEVVPGVTSFTAAAARAGLPLANQDERIAVLPTVKDTAEAVQILSQFDTVVFLKVNAVFDRVLAALEQLDLVDRAVWVHKATAPGAEEIVTDIRSLVGRGRLPYLSLLLVRK